MRLSPFSSADDNADSSASVAAKARWRHASSAAVPLFVERYKLARIANSSSRIRLYSER